MFSLFAKQRMPSTTPAATRSVCLVRISRSRLRKPVSMMAATVLGSISRKAWYSRISLVILPAWKVRDRGTIVTVHEAGGQAVGAVGIGRIERRGNLEAGGLVVDIFTRVIVDGDDGRARDNRSGGNRTRATGRPESPVRSIAVGRLPRSSRLTSASVSVAFPFPSTQTAPGSLPAWPATMPTRNCGCETSGAPSTGRGVRMTLRRL